MIVGMYGPASGFVSDIVLVSVMVAVFTVALAGVVFNAAVIAAFVGVRVIVAIVSWPVSVTL